MKEELSEEADKLDDLKKVNTENAKKMLEQIK
jgi:hypothetical protein